jgi:hypothetical protein
MSIVGIALLRLPTFPLITSEIPWTREYNRGVMALDPSAIMREAQVGMRGSDDRNLVLLYIYLATGVVTLGVGITFAILFVCAYYAIDITKHLWLLAIPPASSLLINVFLIELYRKLTKR